MCSTVRVSPPSARASAAPDEQPAASSAQAATGTAREMIGEANFSCFIASIFRYAYPHVNVRDCERTHADDRPAQVQARGGLPARHRAGGPGRRAGRRPGPRRRRGVLARRAAHRHTGRRGRRLPRRAHRHLPVARRRRTRRCDPGRRPQRRRPLLRAQPDDPRPRERHLAPHLPDARRLALLVRGGAGAGRRGAAARRPRARDGPRPPGPPQGRVDGHGLADASRGTTRTVRVYTPAAQPPQGGWPVAVLLDGEEWWSLPLAPLLDRLIAAGTLPPMLVAMVPALDFAT